MRGIGSICRLEPEVSFTNQKSQGQYDLGILIIFCGKSRMALQYVIHYMPTAEETAAKIAATSQRIGNSLSITFNHCPKLIRAMAKPASSTPPVGEMRFVNPFPNWYAVTTASRLTPTRSPNGASTGIVKAASPDEEGTKNVIILCTTSMMVVNK